MSEPAPEDRPSFPRLRRIDALWFRGEQALCGVMFLAMALVVFAQVVREVFGTRRSWLDVALLFAFCYGALRTRVVKEGERRLGQAASLAIAAAATAALAGLVLLYVDLLPGGFVWAPKMALCMMLWVAFLGASMATYERRHLALEFGEKLWPARARHLVKAFTHALTSLCCLALLYLSVDSLRGHYHSWRAADGYGDLVPTLDWLPQWVVFLVFPYVFGVMTLRLAAQAVTTATRTAVEGEEHLPT